MRSWWRHVYLKRLREFLVFAFIMLLSSEDPGERMKYPKGDDEAGVLPGVRYELRGLGAPLESQRSLGARQPGLES